MLAPASVPQSFERPTPASRAKAKAQVLLDDVRTKALRNAQNAGLLPLLRRAEATLKARQLAMAVHGGEPMTPTIADALLGQVREAMIALQPGMVDMLGRLAETNAKLGARSTVEMLALFEGSPKGALRPIAVLEAVAAGSTVLERHASSVARYGQHVIGRFRDVMQEGILLGDTFDEMTRRIQKTGGAVLPTRGWAERIVRTEGMAALNAGAHLEMVEQHATAFPDLEKKLIETFDARTAEDSYPAHGQVRPLNGFFRDGKGREYLYPPGRPNDRGVTIPWRRAWLEPDQGDAAETTATTAEPPQPPVTLPVEPTPAEVPPPRPVPVPAPPVPAVEAPGPRSLTPSGFLPAFRNAVLRAGASGELDEVRGVVKGLLRGQGMTSSDDARALAGAGRFRIASEAEERSLLSGADGVHGWNGEVVMKRSSWLAAKHAAQELKGLSGDALKDALRGMSSTRRHNLTVVIHEELHGHSPILPSAYRGHGVGLEEAITETLARSTLRKVGGMAPDEAARGFATPRYDHAKGRFVHAATNSYDHYLDDLHGAALKIAGGSPDALPALLERAMVKTRSGAYRGLATPEAHFEALADAMGKSGRGAELHAEFDRLQRARAADAAAMVAPARARRARGARAGDDLGKHLDVIAEFSDLSQGARDALKALHLDDSASVKSAALKELREFGLWGPDGATYDGKKLGKALHAVDGAGATVDAPKPADKPPPPPPPPPKPVAAQPPKLGPNGRKMVKNLSGEWEEEDDYYSPERIAERAAKEAKLKREEEEAYQARLKFEREHPVDDRRREKGEAAPQADERDRIPGARYTAPRVGGYVPKPGEDVDLNALPQVNAYRLFPKSTAHHLDDDVTHPSGESNADYKKRLAAQLKGTKEEVAEVVGFTGGGFGPIRLWETGGTADQIEARGMIRGVFEEAEKKSAAISAAVRKSTPEPGTAFRGMENVPDAQVKALLARAPGFGLGHEGKGATSSATWSPDVGYTFAGAPLDGSDGWGVLFAIRGKSQVGISHVSIVEHEHEVLFSKDARFKITGVARHNGRVNQEQGTDRRMLIVELEEL